MGNPVDILAVIDGAREAPARSPNGVAAPKDIFRELSISQEEAVSTEVSESQKAPLTKSSVPLLSSLTTDDEIIHAFGYSPEKIKQASGYHPGMFIASITKSDSVGERIGQSPVGPVLKGIRDPIAGLAQAAVHVGEKIGLQTADDVALIDLRNKVAKADYDQNWLQGKETTVGQDVAELAGSMLVPLPGGKLSAAKKALGPVIRGGVVGGAVGGASMPVYTNDGDFFSNKAIQMGAGAVVGGTLAPVLVKGALPLATKIARTGKPSSPSPSPAPVLMKGPLTLESGRVRPVKPSSTSLSPETAEIMALGERHGVPLTYGDISGNPVVKRAEVASEQLPVGMQALRHSQQTAAKAAAARLLPPLLKKMKTPMSDRLSSAEGGGTYTQKLLKDVEEAGGDWTRLMQNSARLSKQEKQDVAARLYDKVGAMVEEASLPRFPVRRSYNAASNALKDVEGQVLSNPRLYNRLRRIEQELWNRDSPKKAKEAGGFSFKQFRNFRSEMGDLVREAPSGSKERRHYSMIKEAVEKDIDGYFAALESLTTYPRYSPRDTPSPASIAKAWRKANAFYQTNVVPYKDRLLNSSLTSDLPDEIYGKWVQPGKGDRAAKFYKALDPKGRSAVRYGMVSTAINEATEKTSGIFSPKKFVDELNKISEAKNVFFQGKERWELDGFAKLMSRVERAGAFHTQGGSQRILPWMISGGAVAYINPTVAASGIALGAFAKTLFTTKAGMRFLLTSSTLDQKSPRFAKEFAKFLNSTPELSGKGIGSELSGE